VKDEPVGDSWKSAMTASFEATGADAHDRRPGDVFHEAEDIGVVAVGDDRAVARHDADDVREGPQDIVEVAEDIRVVELAVVDREDVRQVLDELCYACRRRPCRTRRLR